MCVSEIKKHNIRTNNTELMLFMKQSRGWDGDRGDKDIHNTQAGRMKSALRSLREHLCKCNKYVYSADTTEDDNSKPLINWNKVIRPTSTSSHAIIFWGSALLVPVQVHVTFRVAEAALLCMLEKHNNGNYFLGHHKVTVILTFDLWSPKPTQFIVDTLRTLCQRFHTNDNESEEDHFQFERQPFLQKRCRH